MESKKIKSNIFDARLLFKDAQIDALHEKFYRHETYPKDELSKTIKIVNSVNVKTLSPTALEKFQSLCGRLHKINTKMMVDAIVDEAQTLKKDGVKNPQDIQFLRKAITDIWKNHTLSEIDSDLLRVAALTLAKLSSKKKSNRVYPSYIHLNQEKEVLPESTVKGTKFSTDWEKTECAFKLLEIAGLLYQGKLEKGLAMIKTLPHEIKLPPISETSSIEEIGTFIQEVVVKSYEIGRQDGYIPSSEEILELLEEASSLS